MDGCLAFWQIGCKIDWEAWGAIGSMLAVVLALGLAIHGNRVRSREQAKINKVVAYQIHFELKRIYNIATWCLLYNSSVESGRVPENYTKAIQLAITDLRKLETPVFDAYGQVIPKFEYMLASTVIAAYSTIKKNIAHIDRHIEQHGLKYDQENFNKLCSYASDLQAGTAVAVGQSAKYSGLNPAEATKCGPESYSDRAAYQ
jgi:hypothetical protein